MKIAIVAGGTGGHIYPALTLADELRDRGHSITFFGSNDRMEKDVVPANGYKYIGLDVYSTQGNKIKSLFSLIKGYLYCKKVLNGFDMAIGFGNYISIPVILAAHAIGIKTVIHEQNSFVGRANRMLDKKVDLVIGSYEDNLKQFENKNIKILGNPQAAKALKVKKDEKVIKNLGLDSNKKTVVMFMGSLGSETVTKILLDYFRLTKGDYQIVYGTGKSYFNIVNDNVNGKDYIKVFERINGVEVMKNASLLVSRAGATTLTEVISIGIPSILIPSPYVPNNHQFHNAMALVENDAALIIEEKDLTAAKLSDTINSVIFDDKKLNEISMNALKMSNTNVLNDIVKEIESL